MLAKFIAILAVLAGATGPAETEIAAFQRQLVNALKHVERLDDQVAFFDGHTAIVVSRGTLRGRGEEMRGVQAGRQRSLARGADEVKAAV